MGVTVTTLHLVLVHSVVVAGSGLMVVVVCSNVVWVHVYSLVSVIVGRGAVLYVVDVIVI